MRLLAAALSALWGVEAQIRVVAPEHLAQQFRRGDGSQGAIYGATATFGAPYYGERVLGRLLYGESLHGKDHCEPDDYSLAPPPGSATSEHAQGAELVNVVLVRRGQCTFVTKVRVAEGKDAHAVIVVDKESSTKTPEEIQHVVVADDGWGDSIKIPSVLISRDEGQKLIDAAREGTVVVELAWDIPHAEVVLADFWMSSGSRESLEFLERFKSCAETLRYHLQFEPHYHIFSLPEGAGLAHLCADGWKAKHCAPDPDGPGPITGADVANEDLRQLCIWRTTRIADEQNFQGATYSQLFWEYVVRLGADCPVDAADADYRFGDKCSARAMEKVGIDVAQIHRCERENADKYLDEQIKNVAWSPQALRLNGWRYSGPLDPEAVLKAICSGYASPPQECRDLLGGSGIATLVAGALTLPLLAWSVLGLALLLAAVFVFYRRHVTKSVRKVLREEVMLEVQSQMAEYAPMSEEDYVPGRGPLSF